MKKPRRLIAYRPRPGQQHSGLGLASIEVWPAAGGGLLVGLAEPALAGAAPLRPAVKTAFIRVDLGDGISVLLPYVALEDEVRACLRTLVAEELAVPERRIEISDRGTGIAMVDVGQEAEWSLRACTAVARTLLVSAAAEIWGTSASLCGTVQGIVSGPGGTARYGDIAADAALCDLPHWIRLRGDRYVSLSPSARGARDGLAFAD